jgi:hypothetical protein
VDAIVRELKNQGYSDDDTILFYADDGLIAGTDKEKIQQLLTTITDLFERIGLRMNAGKTKALISQPTITNHRICTPAFNRRKSGEGPSYLSDNRALINCTVCGLELQRRSYKRHLINKHNQYTRPEKRSRTSHLFNRPSRTYRIDLINGDETECPAPLCPGTYKTAAAMRSHFQYRHWQDTIIIEREGQLPQCERCLLFTSNANTNRHLSSKRCAEGHQRRIRREQQHTNEMSEDTTILINNTPIENIDHFKYLGRTITASGTDQIAANNNLRKARKVWSRLSTILRREGADMKTAGNFYKAVVQSTLLYASETWHLPQTQALQPLHSFHRRALRQISNRIVKRYNNTDNDNWIYPDIELAYSDTGTRPLEEYIDKRRTKLLSRVQNNPTYRKARQMEQGLGLPNLFWGPAPTTPTPTECPPIAPVPQPTAQTQVPTDPIDLPPPSQETEALNPNNTPIPQQELTTPNPSTLHEPQHIPPTTDGTL